MKGALPVLIVLLASAGELGAQSLTNGLIFYAPFSNSFNDVQGGLLGAAVGGATLESQGGVSGGYLKLTNHPTTNPPQYVYFSDPTPATSDFSFQVWVRSTNAQNGQAAGDPSIAANKDWDSGANVGWVLSRYISTGTEFKWNFNTQNGTRKDFDPGSVTIAVVFDGSWHQILVSYQRSGSVAIYRDGSLINSTDISSNTDQSLRPALGSWVTNNILALGQDATLRYDHASGTSITTINADLDEVAMWGRALSDADALTAYIKGTNGSSLSTPLLPIFLQQPQGATRSAGQTYEFTCSLAGDVPTTFHWFKNSDALPNSTNAQLLLSNLATNDSGTYDIVVTAEATSITSAPAVLTVLSPDTNLTHTIQDVRHVVIFMQENRSFDHYFGTMAGVRGFADSTALAITNGVSDFYQPGNGSNVLPFATSLQCLVDLDHDWTTGHDVWNYGYWNQWVAAKGTTTMSYYTRADLPFHYALADAYTICDNYYCSVLGPTNPNRLYLWTGMIDPEGTGGGPVIDNSEPGFTWTTYPERLQAAGISWKVYQEADNYDDNALEWFTQYRNASPGNPLYDNGVATVPDLVSALQSDVSNDVLPSVSWIIAPAALSEHPPYSPDAGAVLTQQLLDALGSNPTIYNSTVFMLTYDENDGFFDHLPSPTPVPGTADEFVDGLPIGLGVRVPMILVSPWSRGGYVCSQVFDHSSIIRFLETWTGVHEPNISAWRRQVCGDLTSAFDFKNPNPNYPNLPAVDAVSCSDGATPSVPSPQTFPAQETGHLIARPLPYQPNATSSADCATGGFYITMANTGSASSHFAIYVNANFVEPPREYDIDSSDSVTDYFSTTLQAAGAYDLTCYGPNGFLRRFAGNISNNCEEIEVQSAVGADSLSLTMQNPTGGVVSFNITNSFLAGTAWSYNVPAYDSLSVNFPVVMDNNGWYDFTATANGVPAFVRRFAGHIEATFPWLTASLSGANLVLSYPDWASGYALESSTKLAPDSWAPVNTKPNIVGSTTIATLPTPGTNSQFFRLRY